MKLIGLLVPLCLIPVMEGEVIPNMVTPQNPNNIPFGPCTRFFLNNQPIAPPALVRPRYQQICQMLGGVHRYATLYDTQNRIPVYSAYHYTIHPPGLNEIGWMIEPQVG